MSFNPNPVPGYGIGTGPFLSYLHIYVPLEWSSEKKTMQEEVLYTTAFIRNGTYGISQWNIRKRSIGVLILKTGNEHPAYMARME